MDILIIDGYNIIGAWDELQTIKQQDLSQSRDRLIDLMADYQAYAGIHVLIVFDAHYVPGMESKHKMHKIDMIFTKENETADECIERLITVYKNVTNQVYVATSDFLEQRITFGRGALRKSARELYLELKEMQGEIGAKIATHQKEQPQTKITLNENVLAAFERWRRGK